MTYIISPAGIRDALYGIKVDRATAALPATALGNIFTVTGGRVVITSLVGEVTTVVQNQACTLSIGVAPTVGTGSATALGTASSIIAAPVGTHLAAAPGGAVVVDLATQAGVVLAESPFLVDPGSITITTSATNTGSVKWSLTYVPYEDAGVVVAA